MTNLTARTARPAAVAAALEARKEAAREAVRAAFTPSWTVERRGHICAGFEFGFQAETFAEAMSKIQKHAFVVRNVQRAFDVKSAFQNGERLSDAAAREAGAA